MLHAGIATRIPAFPTGYAVAEACRRAISKQIHEHATQPLLPSATLFSSRRGLAARGRRGLRRLLARPQAFPMMRFGGSFGRCGAGFTSLSGRGGVRLLTALRGF